MKMARKRTAILIGIAGGVVVTALVWLWVRHWRPRWSIVQGAVMQRDTDPRKEVPIAGALITASHGTTSLSTQSDATGYFRIAFPETVLPGQTVTLTFRDRDYEPLDLQVPIRFRSSLRELVVAAMTPIAAPTSVATERPPTVVQNVKVRYTVNSQSDQNIGSAVRTFDVVNRANVPCRHHAPCSPDGFWKASTNSVTLDAGAGNEFQDARASCIAGPCPFTLIDSSGFANGGRTIVASAMDWSDTATFLVQAEVFHTSTVSIVRESYPVIFGRTLNFTVPQSAEGVSLEAELAGLQIVFPLGPDLYLNWATCTVRTGTDTEKSTLYQCQLKPGFRF
jgi:hypothetical protein